MPPFSVCRREGGRDRWKAGVRSDRAPTDTTFSHTIMKTNTHLLVLLSAAGLPVAANAGETKTTDAALLARGEYLTNKIGLCGDCHTPRGERGALVMEKHLQGAVLGFAPTVPMPWGPYAPAIAGLPPAWTDGDMTEFLMCGKRPGGAPAPRPPMPEYRFSKADAEAVTAYIRSLKTAGQ